MPEMNREKKIKSGNFILGLGVLFLLIGFSPWLYSYKIGIILFVFCQVAIFYIKIVVSEPERVDQEGVPPIPDAPKPIQKSDDTVE